MTKEELSPAQMSDEELVNQFLVTQNISYFVRLHDRYREKVHRKCLTFTKDETIAEDFTQEVFYRLLHRLSSYKQEARFSTWLFSVTQNYCTDQLRRIRRRAETPLEEDMDWVDDVESTLAEDQELRVQTAMDGLGPDEQTLLRMKYTEKSSIRDIADQYELTESAVKMRLKRAKEKLRKEYMKALVWLTFLAGLAARP